MPDTDLVALIEPLARAFYGEPNRQQSSKTELRFGKNGSLSVDLKKATWFDFETQEGGGVLDLIKRAKGFQDSAQCFVWLEENGYWTNGRVRANGNGGGAGQQEASFGKQVATYDYVDEAGELLFQVVRYEPKNFRQRAPDGNGGWTWRVRGIRQVPYRLPEVIEALAAERQIFIVEGEKDADNLWKLGVPATCNAGGAGKWRSVLDQFFIDADVVVIADNDPQATDKNGKPLFHEDGRPRFAGFDHAHSVAREIAEKVARVRVLDLGQWWLDCPPKGDISDWINANGTVELLNDVVEKLPDWSFDQAQKPKPAPAQEPIKTIPLVAPFPIDESKIPPREWVIPGFLMRKQITVLVAPSGSGKSLLTLQVGLTSTVAEPWSGWRPRGKLKVLFVNSEDDVMEMTRRLAAAVMVMGFRDRQEEIAPRFMIADDPNGVVLAKFDARSKTLVRTPHLEELVRTVIDNRVDIIFVDPFAETFEGDENSNSELKWAGILWREVARRTNAAVCLVHHTKKYASGMAGDVDAARGASALIGIARLVATLFPMTTAEAQVMGITDEAKPTFLRYDDAKANLNLKSPFARWFKKVTRTLANATDDLPADDVGALEPWSPPGPFEGITDETIRDFWVRLDVGIVDGKGNVTGEFYCFSKPKGDEESRYVGDLVMKQFNFQTKDKKRADDIVKIWKDANQFQEARYVSPRQRKPRSCVHSLDWKPPEEPPDNILPFTTPPKKE